MSFEDLGLSPDTLKAVTEAGYTTDANPGAGDPRRADGTRRLGVAETGTGKTAAFTMPMIDILADGRSKARMPRTLIIAPTRELAAQIADNFIKYGKYHPLSMALLIGGESMTDQEKALDRGVDVLIATPGRLLDHFERGRILLNDVKVLVIDEADRMLDMGFIPDVERIVSLLPKIRQTLFFSATMDKEIKKLADKFLMNPKEIAVSAAGDRGRDRRAGPGHGAQRRQARGAAPYPARQRRPQRLHLLQSQEGRRYPVQVAREARLQRRRAARRHAPVASATRCSPSSRPTRPSCWCAPTWPRAASTSPMSAT